MPTATPALNTTPTLIIEPIGDHEALFFRVEISDTLLRQIDQLHALLERAPADADVTSVTALARANASLVTRYPRTLLDDEPSDPIFQRLTSLELDIDPDSGERVSNTIGYGGMTLMPTSAYPDPNGIFDERALVYVRLHAASHEVGFESWYGDDSTVESRTIAISTLRELLRTTSEATA